jgi:dienelactone hydrolase
LKQTLGAVLMLLVLMIFFLSSQSITLPKPSGKYPVGTQYLFFVDDNRPETFTDDPLDRRNLTVRVWYPADNFEGSDPAPYIKNAEVVTRLFQLGGSYVHAVTHSKLNAPIYQVKEAYPVLVFNHGWGEFFAQNTILMEELASHGYIVFSIAHHYECKFSFYPDGKMIFFDENSPQIQKIMAEQKNPVSVAIFQSMFTAGTDREREDIFQKSTQLLPTFFTESPRLWTEDIKFLLDQLALMNRKNTKYSGRLDLDKIGVFGMSMGGIAAQKICFEDSRCQAGISMDGGFYGDCLNETISRPFMFINSYRYSGYEKLFLKHLKKEGYVLTIPGADHYNFHDVSILDPNHPMLGKIDGKRMMEILNAYVLAFFNRYLKGENSSLFDSHSIKYPEVKFFSKRPEDNF